VTGDQIRTLLACGLLLLAAGALLTGARRRTV
jgi:hypothetical protein